MYQTSRQEEREREFERARVGDRGRERKGERGRALFYGVIIIWAQAEGVLDFETPKIFHSGKTHNTKAKHK